MFTVIYTDTFREWLDTLTDDEIDSILATVALLQEYGHRLNRPYADTITGSNLTNLKELRTQHKGKPYRTFFVFDPLRQAVLLCGGNKTGDKRFYKKMIPIAERVYSEYLSTLENDK